MSIAQAALSHILNITLYLIGGNKKRIYDEDLTAIFKFLVLFSFHNFHKNA